MKLRQIGEFGWISRMRTRLPKPGKRVLAGIGDDAAWLKMQKTTLVTCDLLIENVHFLRELTPPRLLGRKSLSVNISDIAAMAGIPEFAIVAAGFPQDIELGYADQILEGMMEVASENKVEIVGGDTTASSVLTLAVTVLGKPGPKGPVLRSTARPGDELWVTGTVGDAGLGFEILKQSRQRESGISELHYSSLTVRHLDPRARVEPGLRLAGVATAMIDVSDGILNDLARILEESSKKVILKAGLEVEKIPLSEDFKKYFDGQPLKSERGLSLALTGGEDYELLFSAAPAAGREIRKISAGLELPITRIGKLKAAAKTEIVLRDRKGKRVPAPRLWFEHFPQGNKAES